MSRPLVWADLVCGAQERRRPAWPAVWATVWLGLGWPVGREKNKERIVLLEKPVIDFSDGIFFTEKAETIILNGYFSPKIKNQLFN